MSGLAVIELGREHLPEVGELYAHSLRANERIPLYRGVDDSPLTTVLGVTERGTLVGTVSYTADGPADGPAGLHTDEVFPGETNVVRAEGRRLFAAWRIATSSEHRHHPSLVMGMIREVVLRLASVGMETTLMVFPHEQVRAYELILGATVIAERKVTSHIGSATAVLMRADIETLRAHRKFRDLL